MMKDYFRIALRNLLHRRLRTFLTLIGIFIGIAAVVSLISLAQGFQNYLETEFKQLGADKILITPSGSSFGATTSSNPLTLDDLAVVQKVNGVKEVGFYRFKPGKVEWGKNDLVYAGVMYYDLGEGRKLMEEVMTLDVSEGRMLKESDRSKAFIGYDYANYNGFDRNIHPGNKINVNGVEFEVVGIAEKIGNPNDDRAVYLTEYGYEKVFGDPGDDINAIFVRVNEGKQPSEVLKNIEKALRDHRNLKKGQEDFEAQTFEDLIKSFLTILNIVGFVLIGIAAISLVVGGIGIMNTMYTAVVERTKEIGIMKAIGARNSDILSLFLIESGFLGLIGGALGVIIGIGFAKLVEFVGINFIGTELLRAAMPFWLIIGALGFAFILGSVSGLLPARQASKMNPVDALRAE